MTDKDIQKLIDRYLEGTTSPEEEKALARELLREDITAEWQAVRMMLGELTLGEAEYDAILAQRRQKPSAILMAIRTISSMAAIYLVGLFFFINEETPQQPVAIQKTQDNGQSLPTLCEGSTPRELYMCYMERKRETQSVYSLIKKRIYENEH